MGFLDHLFPSAASAAVPPQTDAGETGQGAETVGTGTQFLHPKPPPARLAPALRIGAQSSAGHALNTLSPTVSPKPNLNPTPAPSLANQLQPPELVLTVGEILPHLPTEAIKPGLHDADAVVRFAIGDLSSDIARGRATILLSKLAALCPELVHKPEAQSADHAIRLPLQKLVEQLTTFKAPKESERIEHKPVHLPEGSLEVKEPAPSAASPEVSLAETHGDLVGYAAPPVWLDPVKKARATARAAKPAREGGEVKPVPAPRGRRIKIANPALPPTPTLAKSFAKRKATSPASAETADANGVDESVPAVGLQQQHAPEAIAASPDPAAEDSSAQVEVAAVDIGVLEADHSTVEMSPEISTTLSDATPVTSDPYTESEVVAEEVPEEMPTESESSERAAMELQQEPVPEATTLSEELAAAEFPVQEETGMVEIAVGEADLSTGEISPEVLISEDDSERISEDQYIEPEVVAAEVPEEIPSEPESSEPAAMDLQQEPVSEAVSLSEELAAAEFPVEEETGAAEIAGGEADLSTGEISPEVLISEDDSERISENQYIEPEVLAAEIPEETPAESEIIEPAAMELQQERVAEAVSLSEELAAAEFPVEEETGTGEIAAGEADLSTAEISPELLTSKDNSEPIAADQHLEPAALVAAVPEEIPAESDTSAPEAMTQESHAASFSSVSPEHPEPMHSVVSKIPESASETRNTDVMVTNPPSDPKPAPETQKAEDSTSESLQPAIPEEPKAFTFPSTSTEEQVRFPVIPTPPRIRPPAPPPPVLVTPAAGLREAISQSSTGENPNEARTAPAQSSFGEPRTRNAWTPEYPQAEVAKPWKPSDSAPENPDEGSRSTDAPSTATGFRPTYGSAPMSSEAQHEPEPATTGVSAGVRPPPIQFPGSVFASSQTSIPAAETHSTGERHEIEHDSASSVPVSKSQATNMASPRTQERSESREVDEQKASNHQSTPPQQMPVQSSAPASLVAARPAATVAVTSSSMPSRSLALFNQENLQALFMTEELLDGAGLARHVAALPGITACALFAGDEASQSGEFPPDFDLDVLREMGVQFVASANVFGGRLLGREVENVTIQGGGFSVTLFARVGLCLCVVHRARGFLPGVREKLAAVADELAKGA